MPEAAAVGAHEMPIRFNLLLTEKIGAVCIFGARQYADTLGIMDKTVFGDTKRTNQIMQTIRAIHALGNLVSH